MNGGGGYLLDTNIVLALMRSNRLGQFIEATYGLRADLNRSLVSVVTVGEMLSLARQFGWGKTRITALEGVLNQLVWIDINNPQILDAYGELDHESRKIGRPMGENDVWIAATARVSGTTLLTTDKDFRPPPRHLDRPHQDRSQHGHDAMRSASQQVVSKAWNFAHVLRDDGLSSMAYVEQITFLLFLTMADEQTKPPYNRKPIVPAGYGNVGVLRPPAGQTSIWANSRCSRSHGSVFFAANSPPSIAPSIRMLTRRSCGCETSIR